MRIVIATTNPGKLLEFEHMLADLPVNWRMLTPAESAEEVAETGHTFRANSVIKASAYAKRTGSWTVADDSGLEVDALDSAPGIYSARWSERHDAGRGDDANNALLLKQLRDVPGAGRGARFVCVLALSDPRGRIVATFRGQIDGRIDNGLRGTGGFGYDPLFRVGDSDRTMAELEPAQKHQISHRGRALRQLRLWMTEVGSSLTASQ